MKCLKIVPIGGTGMNAEGEVRQSKSHLPGTIQNGHVGYSKVKCWYFQIYTRYWPSFLVNNFNKGST